MKRTAPTPKKRIRRKLLRVLDRRLLDPDLLALFAGDRKGTPQERAWLSRIRRKRGERFPVDVIFSITHREFPPVQARTLWKRILRHKRWMGRSLGRNPGYLVAAADYICNVAKAMSDPLLLPRTDVPAVAEVALQDGLTHLYDQASFRLKLEAAIARCRKRGGGFSVVMMDVDDFKAFNDRYGHPQGSRRLARVGGTIRRELRDGDIASRYGGEEFALLIDHAATQEAVVAAERIRTRVARRWTRLRRVTLSAGIATYPRHGRTARSLIRKADWALYRAKRMGKNRVVVFRR
jgi:diguanylate cyclase (GGDEF)-like protein